MVANHQSIIDPASLSLLWPRRCSAVIKSSLAYTGPLGLIFYLCQAIFITRSRREDAIKAMQAAADQARRDNLSVFVFPEGTRGQGDELLPFKKGAFYLAVQCQYPIQPIVIAPYSQFLDHRTKRFDKGMYYVQVLPQISTQGKDASDVDALIQETRNSMVECFEQLKLPENQIQL